MEKILRKSGPFSNEGVKAGLQVRTTSLERCDDETMVKKRCNKLNESFYKNFRTLEGHCNNQDHPHLGSVGSRLSRLIPAEYRKFQKETFNQKPSNLSKSQASIF